MPGATLADENAKTLSLFNSIIHADETTVGSTPIYDPWFIDDCCLLGMVNRGREGC